MTQDAPDGGSRRVSLATIAVALSLLVIVIALLTPEQPARSAGGMSSYSTAPGGAGIMYELATRFGWRTERRLTTLDSLARRGDTVTTVQVELAPSVPLGARETHALLENVRRGGGLVLSLDGDDELTDSLGLGSGFRASYFASAGDPKCLSTFKGMMLDVPPQFHEILWRGHAPAHLDTLASSGRGRARMISAVGFTLGRGRIAVVGGSGIFSNEAVRVCRWNADLAAMNAIDYTRPASPSEPRLVFDEFHHGFGTHASTAAAAAGYLWHTSSGRSVLQLLVAGLLLLVAMAPRPLPPRDDTRVTRRSPLEHAEALGRAYEDVHATRSATTTLLGGVRRRTKGVVPVPASASDDAFLAAAVHRLPSLQAQVAVVRQAQFQDTPERAFAAVGEALATIEAQLLSTPSSSK